MTSINRYRRWLLLATSLLVALAPSSAADNTPKKSVTINVTDTGIHGFARKADPRPDPLYRTPFYIQARMPPPAIMQSMSDETLHRIILERMRCDFTKGAGLGHQAFELRVVQNLNFWGYNNPATQAQVTRFSRATYAALSDITQNLARTNRLAIFGTFGSHGTVAFARATNEWRGIADHIGGVTLVDGRASLTDFRDIVSTLGETRVRLLVSQGDVPGLATVAGLGTAKTLAAQYPRMQTYQLDRIGAGGRHIASMSDSAARFRVKQVLSDGSLLALGEYTGAEIHQLLDADQYFGANKQFRTLVQLVPKNTARTTPLPHGTPIGGVDLGKGVVDGLDALPNLAAAIIDADHGLVLVGDEGRLNVGLKATDIAMALWLVLGPKALDGVRFSLDPFDPRDPKGPWLRAVYLPEATKGTSIGHAMFLADYEMKAEALGVLVGDHGTQAPRLHNIPGYENYANLALKESRPNAREEFSRFWFVDHVAVRATANGMVLDAKLRVQTRRQIPDPSEPSGLRDVETDPNSLESRWAQMLTAHLRELARTTPSFGRLEELAKTMALAKILRQRNVAIDLGHVIRLVKTDKAPLVNRVRTISVDRTDETTERFRRGTRQGVRTLIRTLRLTGGVNLSARPVIARDDGSVARLTEAVMRAVRSTDRRTKVVRVRHDGRNLRVIRLPLLAHAPSPSATRAGNP